MSAEKPVDLDAISIPDPLGDGLAITKEEVEAARRALYPTDQ